MSKHKFSGLVVLALMLVVSSAFAATPSNGTLNAPAAGQTSSISFSGGPFTGATATTAACTSLTCDTFTLTVNVPSTFYSANPSYAVHVKINWASNTNDFDLNVCYGTPAQGMVLDDWADDNYDHSGLWLHRRREPTRLQ